MKLCLIPRQTIAGISPLQAWIAAGASVIGYVFPIIQTGNIVVFSIPLAVIGIVIPLIAVVNQRRLGQQNGAIVAGVALLVGLAFSIMQWTYDPNSSTSSVASQNTPAFSQSGDTTSTSSDTTTSSSDSSTSASPDSSPSNSQSTSEMSSSDVTNVYDSVHPSPKPSPAAVQSVNYGMTKEQVINLLGKPYLDNRLVLRRSARLNSYTRTRRARDIVSTSVRTISSTLPSIVTIGATSL